MTIAVDMGRKARKTNKTNKQIVGDPEDRFSCNKAQLMSTKYNLLILKCVQHGHLALNMLGYFSCFCCRLLTFSRINFLGALIWLFLPV